jgi:hypothetical protein
LVNAGLPLEKPGQKFGISEKGPKGLEKVLNSQNVYHTM